MAVQPPTSLGEPQFRRNAKDIPDPTAVAGITRREIAFRPEDGCEGSIEVPVEQRTFGFSERA
jgi:hypothetical protein